MHFYLFLSFSIYTLFDLLLGLYVCLNYAMWFWLIYDICGYLVMGLVFYDYVLMIDVSYMHLKFYLGHYSQRYSL